MTTMITEVYEAFKEANVSDAKAIAAATAIPAKDNLATKEDLLEVRSELKEDLLNLETRLDKRIDALRLDLQTGLLKLENKIIVWMGSMLVVAVGVLAVLMKIL